MLTEERFVLSSSKGHVYVMLEKLLNQRLISRGLFIPTPLGLERGKVNIDSGVVKELTASGNAECQMKSTSIKTNYAVYRA